MTSIDLGSEPLRSSRVQLLVVFVACFVAFGALMTLLNWIGVPDRVIGSLFIAVTLAVFVATGFSNRTMQPVNFLAGGRSVPALYNGMATAAGWCSVISLLGLGGALFELGHDGLAYVLGLAGGLLLVAVLFAPYLRKSGAYSVPDFLSARFNSGAVRLAAVAVLLLVTLLLLVTAMRLLNGGKALGVFVLAIAGEVAVWWFMHKLPAYSTVFTKAELQYDYYTWGAMAAIAVLIWLTERGK